MLNFGRQFADQWAGLPEDDLKLEWAEGLGEFDLATIGAALNYWLDGQKYPPSLPQFRQACKDHAPREYVAALPRKFTQDELIKNRERMAQLMADYGPQAAENKAWAQRIIDAPPGRVYPEISKQFAREALGMAGVASAG